MLVCEETIFIMEGLLDTWKGRPVVHTDINEITVAVSISMIHEMATTDSSSFQVVIDGYLRCRIREASSLGRHHASCRTPTGKFNRMRYSVTSHSPKTFKEAMGIVSNDLFIKVVTPDFAMGLTKRTSRVQLGFKELHVSNNSSTLLCHAFRRTRFQKYIREMIHDRTIGITVIFSAILLPPTRMIAMACDSQKKKWLEIFSSF